MFAVHTVLVALHVLFAAAWFGLSLSLPTLARAAGSGGNTELAAAGSRVVSIMGISLVLFYLLAVAAFVVGLNFREYSWPFHVALTLGVLLVAVHFLLLRKSWAQAAEGTGSIGMALGLGHVLWLSMFVLMYLGRVGL